MDRAVWTEKKWTQNFIDVFSRQDKQAASQ